MDQCRVLFLPERVESTVSAGTTLLEAASAVHVPIDAPCGDRGVCGKCRVQHSALDTQHSAILESPTLAERSSLSAEELAEGWRLACQARVCGDVVVQVPERALQSAVVPLSEVRPRPNVRKLHLRIPGPTLEDPASDLTRLRRALAERGLEPVVDLPVPRELPGVLQAASGSVTAVLVGDHLATVEAGDTTARLHGLAVDLGTTSVVAILVDLVGGGVLGIESRLNGQANHGADVVSRITHASSPDGLRELQSEAARTINACLEALLEKSGVDRREIYEAVVVGNTCMNHLLLGIDPASLGRAPYQPAVTDPVDCRASDLGLEINPNGGVYTLPNVAGFVGSDTVAVILATGMHRSDQVRLAIDLGTNGEMVLGNRDRLLACSTAAGPAFEGARISCGMRATQGAIERVWIDRGEVKLQVIGGGGALGLCGSGLLDAVAQMAGAGLLNGSGRLLAPDSPRLTLTPGLARRLVDGEGGRSFLLARRGRRPVLLTQRDIRELQLAKGAIRAGISILLKEYGIGEEDIAEILLAGAFGSFISPASARAIGLIPPLPLDRITAVGNAAGQGALMALLSTELRQEAVRIARSVGYIELSASPDFSAQFMEAMGLG